MRCGDDEESAFPITQDCQSQCQSTSFYAEVLRVPAGLRKNAGKSSVNLSLDGEVSVGVTRSAANVDATLTDVSAF